ncbi:ACT domain-containing protein [Christensenellaceae bacterium NSJ-44]|jgi:ACT domain-containing protein|uniref:UPF0237 protein H8699_02775 n=1 Tax=Luoshenia tenuis TaxID=2763654 RepID=A0A926HI35_9FIRM|nr:MULTISPECIES: ACT domain-containing protein [Clostridia]MBC8528362.1 ACT domain-containing protein [Luoshenia tenuis]SCJ28713.1 ACT domain-containing protein [uncultured Clostridium sp.]
MRAIITVIGNDTVGIISAVSAELAACGANILDISQTTLQEYFAMMMLVDLSGASEPFAKIEQRLQACGADKNVVVHMQHEDIFNAMHRI